MLKPRVDVWLGRAEPLAWVRPLWHAPVPDFPDWSLAAMDPSALAHGVRELASPLSE